MSYLLDTNACIAILNKRASLEFEKSLNRAIDLSEVLCISSICVHELWFGVAKSDRVQINSYNLTQFLKSPFQVLGFNAQDAKVAGEIRAEFGRKGTPIGAYDLLIAAQALVRDMTLVTANTREFARVDGLKIVDWT